MNLNEQQDIICTIILINSKHFKMELVKNHIFIAELLNSIFQYNY